ncbi:MAG: helix-turn-helix transcriptional regulator [Clostridia bacterium]
MTIGEKIKKIRTFRNMKQRDLGIALGFPEHSADNRIAQYETNYRVPKKEALVQIAQILDVNYQNFVEDHTGSALYIVQTFFWLEESTPGCVNLFQMVRNEGKTNANPDTSVRYYDNDDYPARAPVGIWFNYGLANDFMKMWLEKKQQLKDGEITRDQYFDWKLKFPSN